jgi:hypothetical protein
MVAMRDKSSLQRRKDSDAEDDKAGSTGGQIVTRIKHGASDVAGQLKRGVDAVGQTVKEEGEQLFEKQKDGIVSRVRGFGKATRQVAHALHAVKADGLAEYADRAAEQVEGATRYLKESDLETVIEDAGDLAREHQALAAGGLFLVGFALSRFLKASRSQTQDDDDRDAGEPDENESD